MPTVLITGATDGIGLEAAKRMAVLNVDLILHGRSADKLDAAVETVSALNPQGQIRGEIADLSVFADVEHLAERILASGHRIDAIVNNAGVFKTRDPITEAGLDRRFMVNTIAPYLLSRRVEPALAEPARIVNIASAAQAPVNLAALRGETRLTDMEAYAQSKLALIMWSFALARKAQTSPAYIAVNPGSLLATKMVRDGFGVAGNDVQIGAQCIADAAIGTAFASASGRYFDNDAGRFGNPHPDALQPQACQAVVEEIEALIAGNS